MRGLLSFLIYLILIMVSSYLKRAGEKSARPSGLPAWAPQAPQASGQAGEVSAPVPGAGRELAPQEDVYEATDEGLEEEDLELWADEEQEDRVRLDARDRSEPLEQYGGQLGLSKLTEAIIMSEIIREPRALRRWPSR